MCQLCRFHPTKYGQSSRSAIDEGVSLIIVRSLGIQSVSVALLSHKAEVKFYPEYIIPSQIAHLINELGFRAEVLDTMEHGVDCIDLNVG